MPSEYPLLFDHEIYVDMIRDEYNAAQWMEMGRVHARSTELLRSRKNLKALCKEGGVMRAGDTLTMRKTVCSGVTVSVTTTVSLNPRYHHQGLIMTVASFSVDCRMGS